MFAFRVFVWLAALGGCATGVAALFNSAFRREPYTKLIRVGVESAGHPFTFSDEKGQASGFCVELLKEAAREQGLRAEFIVKPWPEILRDFREGRIDVLGNVAYSTERESFIDFSGTNLRMQGGLFIRSDAKPVRSPADLRGLRVASLRDSLGHAYALAQDWQAEIVPVLSREEAIAALRDKRIDAVVMMELVMNYYLRLEGITDIVQADQRFEDLEYHMHFGVHRGNTALLHHLNEGLITVRANGTYDKLHLKWIGPLQPRRIQWHELQPYVLPALVVALLIGIIITRQRILLARITRQAAALRASEERLRLVMEAGAHGIWDYHIATGRVERSDYTATMLGYSPAELAPAAEAWLALIHPEDVEHAREFRRRLLDPKTAHLSTQYRIRAKQGDWVWIATAGKVTERDAQGRALRAIGTHTDVTARIQAEEANKALQQKMLEAQKLESLGVLAGGIAHDFNNLLTAIMGNVSLAREDLGNRAGTAARLDQVLSASKRAADLCRQLLAYAGVGNFEVTRIDLNGVVRDTSEMLSVALAQRARLNFSLGESLPPIEGDASQIQQVVMNLVLNAAESMPPEGGIIKVTTSANLLNPGQLSDALPEPLSHHGVYLCLEITDTGCGMTPEVRAKIFEPFFTTKFSGRGLGLAAVLGIVRSHHGALTVESQPGKGTSFRVYLPMAGVAKPLAAAI